MYRRPLAPRLAPMLGPSTSVITAQNGSKPDTGTFCNVDITQQHGRGGDENVAGYLGAFAIEFNNHANLPFLRSPALASSNSPQEGFIIRVLDR